MTNEAIVKAPTCPACGAPIKIIDSKCSHCGVELVFNYAELLGVQNYKISGRNPILDSVLLALLQKEANLHGFKLVASLRNERMNIYVRLVNLVQCCVIDSYPAHYSLWGNPNRIYIETEAAMGGGNIYRISESQYMMDSITVEGEDRIKDIPMIQKWIQGSIENVFPKEEAHSSIPTRRWYNPMTWITAS